MPKRKSQRLSCSTEGCQKVAALRGMCRTHYQQWYRQKPRDVCLEDGCGLPIVRRGACEEHASRIPELLTGQKRQTAICQIAGCKRASHSRSLCMAHYALWRREHTPLCEVAGCVNNQLSKGLCPMHYRRQQIYGEVGGPSPLLAPTLEESFWRRVTQGPEEECWEWQGVRDFAGYGVLGRERKELAHRISYQLFVGPIPERYQIHHTCWNKSCVNPSHLVAMTPEEHSLVEGSFMGDKARRTHCKNGHELSGDNVYLKARGPTRRPSRGCRACDNQRQVNHRNRNK